MWTAPAPEPGGGRPPPPWLLTFVDTVSLLLTFLVVLVAQGTIGGPAWEATAAGVRAAFDPPPPPPAVARLQQPPPPPALAPGYLAVVLGERLAALPILAAATETATEDGLRLALPASRLFAAATTAPLPAAAAELAVLGRGLAQVDNRLLVRVTPEAADGDGWSDDDWRRALARAIAVGAIFADAGVAAGRVTLLAAADPIAPEPTDTEPAPIAAGQPQVAVIIAREAGRR